MLAFVAAGDMFGRIGRPIHRTAATSTPRGIHVNQSPPAARAIGSETKARQAR